MSAGLEFVRRAPAAGASDSEVTSLTRNASSGGDSAVVTVLRGSPSPTPSSFSARARTFSVDFGLRPWSTASGGSSSGSVASGQLAVGGGGISASPSMPTGFGGGSPGSLEVVGTLTPSANHQKLPGRTKGKRAEGKRSGKGGDRGSAESVADRVKRWFPLGRKSRNKDGTDAISEHASVQHSKPEPSDMILSPNLEPHPSDLALSPPTSPISPHVRPSSAAATYLPAFVRRGSLPGWSSLPPPSSFSDGEYSDDDEEDDISDESDDDGGAAGALSDSAASYIRTPRPPRLPFSLSRVNHSRTRSETMPPLQSPTSAFTSFNFPIPFVHRNQQKSQTDVHSRMSGTPDTDLVRARSGDDSASALWSQPPENARGKVGHGQISSDPTSPPSSPSSAFFSGPPLPSSAVPQRSDSFTTVRSSSSLSMSHPPPRSPASPGPPMLPFASIPRGSLPTGPTQSSHSSPATIQPHLANQSMTPASNLITASPSHAPTPPYSSTPTSINATGLDPVSPIPPPRVRRAAPLPIPPALQDSESSSADAVNTSSSVNVSVSSPEHLTAVLLGPRPLAVPPVAPTSSQTGTDSWTPPPRTGSLTFLEVRRLGAGLSDAGSAPCSETVGAGITTSLPSSAAPPHMPQLSGDLQTSTVNPPIVLEGVSGGLHNTSQANASPSTSATEITPLTTNTQSSTAPVVVPTSPVLVGTVSSSPHSGSTTDVAAPNAPRLPPTATVSASTQARWTGALAAASGRVVGRWVGKDKGKDHEKDHEKDREKDREKSVSRALSGGDIKVAAKEDAFAPRSQSPGRVVAPANERLVAERSSSPLPDGESEVFTPITATTVMDPGRPPLVPTVSHSSQTSTPSSSVVPPPTDAPLIARILAQRDASPVASSRPSSPSSVRPPTPVNFMDEDDSRSTINGPPPHLIAATPSRPARRPARPPPRNMSIAGMPLGRGPSLARGPGAGGALMQAKGQRMSAFQVKDEDVYDFVFRCAVVPVCAPDGGGTGGAVVGAEPCILPVECVIQIRDRLSALNKHGWKPKPNDASSVIATLWIDVAKEVWGKVMGLKGFEPARLVGFREFLAVVAAESRQRVQSPLPESLSTVPPDAVVLSITGHFVSILRSILTTIPGPVSEEAQNHPELKGYAKLVQGFVGSSVHRDSEGERGDREDGGRRMHEWTQTIFAKSYREHAETVVREKRNVNKKTIVADLQHSKTRIEFGEFPGHKRDDFFSEDAYLYWKECSVVVIEELIKHCSAKWPETGTLQAKTRGAAGIVPGAVLNAVAKVVLKMAPDEEGPTASRGELALYMDMLGKLDVHLRVQFVSYFFMDTQVSTPSEVDLTCRTLAVVYSDSLYRLSRGVKSGRQSVAESDAVETLRLLVLEAVSKRYEKIAADEESRDPVHGGDHNKDVARLNMLLRLAKSIREEVQSYMFKFPHLLLGNIDVVELACSTILRNYFILEMENNKFSLGAAKDETIHDLSELFGITGQFYKVVKTLQQLIGAHQLEPTKSSSNRMDFAVEKWSEPLVDRWLTVMERTMKQVVTAYVQADEHIPLAPPDSLFSTSVIDVFASTNEALQLVLDLHWPAISTQARFLCRLSKIIEFIISSYLEAELGKLEQLENRNRVDLGKGLQLTKELCVTINNIRAAWERLADTMELLKIDQYSEHVPQPPAMSREEYVPISRQATYTLKILRGRNLRAPSFAGAAGEMNAEYYCLVRIAGPYAKHYHKEWQKEKQRRKDAGLPPVKPPHNINDLDPDVIYRTQTATDGLVGGGGDPNWNEVCTVTSAPDITFAELEILIFSQPTSTVAKASHVALDPDSFEGEKLVGTIPLVLSFSPFPIPGPTPDHVVVSGLDDFLPQEQVLPVMDARDGSRAGWLWIQLYRNGAAQSAEMQSDMQFWVDRALKECELAMMNSVRIVTEQVARYIAYQIGKAVQRNAGDTTTERMEDSLHDLLFQYIDDTFSTLNSHISRGVSRWTAERFKLQILRDPTTGRSIYLPNFIILHVWNQVLEYLQNGIVGAIKKWSAGNIVEVGFMGMKMMGSKYFSSVSRTDLPYESLAVWLETRKLGVANCLWEAVEVLKALFYCEVDDVRYGFDICQLETDSYKRMKSWIETQRLESMNRINEEIMVAKSKAFASTKSKSQYVPESPSNGPILSTIGAAAWRYASSPSARPEDSQRDVVPCEKRDGTLVEFWVIKYEWQHRKW
ncbi:hypothetical protein HDU93_007951 [Gonapodya sp. JEL0774]|nr:hypothetical protein HDU93_007951 [Gonapodya sp. JEL0774]